ncbi:Ankyrin-3 [Colletotrichum siamense]|uniref:Ankyrin-3 n=1 Tax=Colletotrichum siamense TaxID=690259 RepID=UPI00187240C9|nr:Ankyrin-3 [Colletotrichum siamense]KAF5492027.1 Ankyrin-3 [Colletotrichum siamense]
MANVNIPAPVRFVADSDEDVSPEAVRPTGNNISHGASVLRKFIEDLERSEEGAKEVEMFRYWIDSMVDDGVEEGLDMKDQHSRTLLNVAAIQGLSETAKRLIEAGVALDAQDEWGDTPLIDACGEGDGEGGYIEVVKLLLEKGAKTEIFGNEGDSPLYRACRHGHSHIVQYLLDKVKWDLNVGEDKYDMTPLHAAAVADNPEIVRYLRDKGAQLDRCDTDGWTPLMTAIDSKSKDAMEELLQRRNNEDIQLEKADLEGRTPILRAAEDGFWDGFRLLMEAGAKWTEKESETTEDAKRDSASSMSRKNAALHLAISENQDEVVRFLLEQGADVNSRGQDQRQPLHLASLQGNQAILELIFNTGECNHLNNDHGRGMTPLHLACTADDDDGHYNEAVRLLLDRNPRPHTEIVTNEMRMAVALAVGYGHDERVEAILDVFGEPSSGISDTLMWAIGKTERHKVAAYLLKRQLKLKLPLDSFTTEGSENWTAIEWAAYVRKPQILWLLIASSPRNQETKKALNSAKSIVEESKNHMVKPLASFKNQRLEQGDDARKGDKIENVILDMQDIIHNPPTGLIYTVSATYPLPTHHVSFAAPLSTYEAAMVRFFKKEGQFGNIIQFRTVEDTVYREGPQKIMHKAIVKFEERSRGVEKRIAQRPVFMDSEPKFTWIHLPATNMVWMEDLVQRIMYDEKQDASRFNQAKSFFKDSWIEVPDSFSASRIMRPRFVSRDTISRDRKSDESETEDADKTPGRNGNDKGEKGIEVGRSKDMRLDDDEDGKESVEQKVAKGQDKNATAAPAMSATAIYMPYLSYSFQCAEDVAKRSLSQGHMEESSLGTEESTKAMPPPAFQEDIESRHSNELAANRELEYEEKTDEDRQYECAAALVTAREKYQELLDKYSETIIHGSATLDESYYHFGEDPESCKDRSRRNMSQVVTESWVEDRKRKEEIKGLNHGSKQEKVNEQEQVQKQQYHSQKKQGPGLYWPLIRVNQLWIWTVNNNRLEKQGEAGGSDLQPGSAAEMSQLIVDYCVDYYERKPKAQKDDKPQDFKLRDFPSIRQTFSRSINSIARDETNLFEKFSDLTKELRKQSKDKTGDHSKAIQLVDHQLAEAIIEAEGLSSRVKDILDELSILEATVQYQQDVQRAMKKQNAQNSKRKGNFLETELTATYIINDIKGLGSVAERVHAAVNTTLSLQQSEIANLQAKLSIEHAKFSIEQAQRSIEHAEIATQQGRVLMVFTVVTILFLPLSFLTSLFALDVASFQQAPPWALGVIFSVSAGFFIPMLVVAFSWKRSKKFISDLLSPVLSPIIRRAMALICYLLQLADTSNQTQYGNGVSETVPSRTESSFRGSPRRSAMSIGALQVSRRSNDAAHDVEKGPSGGSDPTNQSNDHEL